MTGDDAHGPPETPGSDHEDAGRTEPERGHRSQGVWPKIPKRRTLLQATAAGITTGLAGCSFLTGDLIFEAAPVRLGAGADERGYALRESSSPDVNRSVGVGDVTKDVTLLSHYVRYDHESGRSVALVSTPAVEEQGQSLNPVAVTPLKELLTGAAGGRFSDQLNLESAFARGPEAVGSGQGELLEQSVEFQTFAGVTERDTFALITAARVESDGDAVLVGAAWRAEAGGPKKPFVGPNGYVGEEEVAEREQVFAEVLPLVRHGSSPSRSPAGTSEPGGTPASVAQPLVELPREDELWTELSGRVAQARLDGEPDRLNQELAEAATSVETPGLGMVFEFWAAENLRMAERHTDAIALFDEVLETHEEFTFLGEDFRGALLRKRAISEEALDQVTAALSTYDELIRHTNGERSRPYYRKGLLAEEEGMDSTAVAAYQNSAAAADPEYHHLSGLDEVASRNADRVADPFDGFYLTADGLIDRLVTLFRERLFGELASLASPTHFMIGPAGGCQEFVDRESLIGQLTNDAEASDISIDREPVTRAGKSVYLRTDGWEGELFIERLDLKLAETPQGWEWSGVVLRVPETAEELIDRWRTKWDPGLWADPETSTPTATATPSGTPTAAPSTSYYATIDIAAPFKKGQRFRAGGLPSPVGVGGGCGVGIPGFYYDFGPTHQEDRYSKYAIDFTQYLSVANTNSAFGKRVLSTNGGVVHTVVDKHGDGANSANKVEVNHLAKNRCGVGTDYRSQYYHLAGSKKFPFSKGSHVKQGSLLGFMDNTGVSAFHHLHFNIINLHTRKSVKPSPMDGHRLDGTDNGTCVASDNGVQTTFPDYTHTDPSC